MSEPGHVYAPPQTSAAKTVPEPVARYLDGTDLPAKTQALRLSTVDAEGWPHASLLSAGDVLIVSPERIRFAVFPQSETTANLTRDGRVVLTLSLDGGMCEVRLRARRLANASPDVPLAFFEAQVETVRMHRAPYAAVTSGITFSLHEPREVVQRWERQIAALRDAT
jgi:hypothetical protein